MARYKKHTISQGDTVQSIAQLQTGDVNQWQTIVQYNNLAYPYIVDTPKEKMTNPERWVTYGDTLIIPIEASLLDTNLNHLGKRDRDLILSLSLGRDLSMIGNPTFFTKRGTSDEILELTSTAKGDIKTVEGIENLKQALISRLLTPIGSLMLHPNYGSRLHELFGKATTEQAKLIEIEIASTLKKDGRVEGVIVVQSTIEESTYQGEFQVQLPSLQEYFSIVVAGDETGNIVLL